jgi:topoisomerase IA-like protein
MARKRDNEPADVERTPDGHYVVIDGRKWRATDPSIPEERRKELVSELMAARRAVGQAKRERDRAAEKAARARVHAAKVALGERGRPWWERKGG